MNASLVTTNIGSLNPKKPVCMRPSAPVLDAIKVMRDTKNGCVLVTEDERLVGVVTERDILRKVVSKDVDPATTQLRSIMSMDPNHLYDDDSVAFALNQMSAGGSRKVTITDTDGRPTGVVTIEDILDYVIEKLNF